MIIPKRFLACSFDNYRVTDENRAGFNAFKAYSDNLKDHMKTGKNFILGGTVGVGKNHLAYSMVKAHCQLKTQIFNDKTYHLAVGDIDFYQTTITDLVADAKASSSFESPEGSGWLVKKAKECGVLILNEVGLQSGTDYENRELFDIFDYRYNECKPTVAISNYTDAEIRKILRGRISDRLFSDCEYVYIDGKSMRKAA